MKKSIFSQILLLVIVFVICIALTVVLAFTLGSMNTTIFDLRNLNFANMIPVFVIGGFISCVVVGIIILFISRTVFLKLKDYFNETNDNGGK